MKHLLPLYFLLLPLALPLTAAEPSLSDQLRDALYTEEVTRDPAAAAKTYTKILADFDQQRPLAATALFRLAEIRRNAGDAEQAIALYQRLLREFPDREAEGKLARQHLATLGGDPPTTGTILASEESAELLRLKKLSKSAPDIIRDPKTLHHAVTKGWPEVTRFLLDQGADPNRSGVLPVAAHSGRLDICRILIDHDEVSPEQMKAAIGSAIRGNRLSVLQYLLEHCGELKNDSGLAFLNQAISHKSNDLAKLLIDQGADLNLPLDTEGILDRSGLFGTPLHQAVLAGDLELFTFLLNRGAEADVPAPHCNTTPLHLASQGRNRHSLEFVETLLKAGADPNRIHTLAVRGLRAARPAPAANSRPSVPIPGSVDPLEKGDRPLRIAWEFRNKEIASALIEGGARIEDQDLIALVEANDPEFLKLYLEHIPRFAPDSHLGKELLESALRLRNDTTGLLIAHGATPSSLETNSDTPFSGAPHNALAILSETFLLPKLTNQPAIQLLHDCVDHMGVVTLAKPSGNRPPPSLPLALLDAEVNYAQPSSGEVTTQWILWRTDPAGKLQSIALDFTADKPLPDLEWGDVIERRLEFAEGGANFQYISQLPPELIWSLSRRVSFPITVEIGGVIRDYTVRGDRIAYDPSIPEVPLLNLGPVVKLLHPDLDIPSDDNEGVFVTIHRKGWQKTRLGLRSKAIARFNLNPGDRIEINRPSGIDARIADYRKHFISLRVNDTSYSQLWQPANQPTLIEVLTSAYAAETWSWHRNRILGDPDRSDSQLGTLIARVSAHHLKTPVVLPNPDLSSIHIRRLDDQGQEVIIEVDLAKAIAACTADSTSEETRTSDMVLQAGDRIELTLLKKKDLWTGFTPQQSLFFHKTLSGNIHVIDAKGDVSQFHINWQPSVWSPSPAGPLPSPPESGSSSTQLRHLELYQGTPTSRIKLLRGNKVLSNVDYSTFLRNDDEIQDLASSPSKPRVRRVPTPPSR